MIKIIKYVLLKDELRFGQISSGPAQRMGGNFFCRSILLFMHLHFFHNQTFQSFTKFCKCIWKKSNQPKFGNFMCKPKCKWIVFMNAPSEYNFLLRKFWRSNFSAQLLLHIISLSMENGVKLILKNIISFSTMLTFLKIQMTTEMFKNVSHNNSSWDISYANRIVNILLQKAFYPIVRCNRISISLWG